MSEPRFALLDVVAVAEARPHHRENHVAARGVVTQVRRYPDGHYRYSIAAADIDDANGIWDEEHLEPTGDRASVDAFASPGRYRMRDVVVVERSDPADAVPHGTRGVIVGWADVEAGTFEYFVRSEGMGDQTTWLMSEQELRPTGERLPRPHRPRPGVSTLVGEEGDVHGQVEYIIVDEVSDHL